MSKLTIIDNHWCELVDRLEQYHDETPGTVANADARILWDDFVLWTVANGYSAAQVQRARDYLVRCDHE